MRFEKVSFETFYKDVVKYHREMTKETAREFYDKIKIPKRGTKHSAGYDFSTPVPITMRKGYKLLIPTGIKCRFEDWEDNWHLQLYVRSSIGIKHGVVLTNGTGVIDGDYYNNADNEGDIFMALHCENDMVCHFDAGERIMQGVLTVHGVTDDDTATGERSGGVGSTGK